VPSILHLAYSNAAGVPGRWAEAHCSAGLDAWIVLEVADEYAFGTPAIIERWSHRWGELNGAADAIKRQIKSADVVMVYDSPFYLELVLGLGKPVLFRAFGSHSRQEPEQVKALLRSPLVRRATAGTGDLALALGIPLVGCPFPELSPAEPEIPPRAVHSPSNRKLKGTQTIERLAERAGWELEIVEDVTHAQVLARKHGCSLVIDQFGDPPHPDGIGVSAIEAMALGLPAIGRASGEVQRMYRELECPVVLVDSEEEFLSQLHRLHDDEERRELGEEGRAWVRSFHDGATRAREDLAALESA